DLDGVNGPDLAVANFVGDDVSVLLNQGDGTFAPAVAYEAGDFPQSVAIGDLDGVNGPDLAVANDSDVSVLFNQGDGTFADAVDHDAGDAPS
ncbi:MAG: VCBS repeat-containing protein, partial [Gammaproteobacteria bacterium]|nr:VCBS repeat-containing protein [Gammaproteobacteria bacterium]